MKVLLRLDGFFGPWSHNLVLPAVVQYQQCTVMVLHKAYKEAYCGPMYGMHDLYVTYSIHCMEAYNCQRTRRCLPVGRDTCVYHSEDCPEAGWPGTVNMADVLSVNYSEGDVPLEERVALA